MSYRHILCIYVVLLRFTRSKFSTLHLSSFSFSRSEISYICKFMPNCLHLIIQSCGSKLEGKDPEKTQASFFQFFLLLRAYSAKNCLISTCYWDLQFDWLLTCNWNLAMLLMYIKAAELWNHPQKRFADRQFLHCSFSELNHTDQEVVCQSTFPLIMQ